MKKYFYLIAILFLQSAFVYSYNRHSVTFDTIPNWSYKKTSVSHNFVLLDSIHVKIGTDTTLQAGDYIGVFYDSLGVQVCAGYIVWPGGNQNIQISAWGDDNPSDSKIKDGFYSGEVINWKVFKKKNGLTYNVSVTVYSGPIVYAGNGMSVITAIGQQSAEIFPPWHFTQTDASHKILIPKDPSPKIYGVSIVEGDYIGVFYDSSGTLACGGYTKWNPSAVTSYTTVTAWGNDALTTVKEGFATNEAFKWKVWRAADRKQFAGTAYYATGMPNDSLFVENGTSRLDSLIFPSATDTSTIDTTKPVVTDTSVIITCDVQFGDGDITKATNYRMIGLPCNGNLDGTPITLDNSIFFGRRPNEDWIAFWDNGSGEYVPYSEANKNKFVFSPGKAFWVLSKYSFKLSELKVKAVVPTSGKTAKIPLIKGWNMISNPFNSNVDWNVLSTYNKNISDPIWDYSEQGKYVLPSGFVPYRGYYFYNRRGYDSLTVPLTVSSTGKISASNSAADFIMKDPIRLTLNTGSSELSYAYIAIVSGSQNSLDDMDQFSPPSNFESASVYLYNEELTTDYKCLFIEARPEIGIGQAFDVRVKHNVPEAVTLKFQGLDKYAQNEIYLINKRSLKFFSLKDVAEVTISSANKTDEFILAIGSKEFFQEIKSDIKPADYLLNQNYPNPFNPSTVISWQLPVESSVTLKIYDVLGRELVTLLNNVKKPAGNNQEMLSLDKFNLSSGVYFYSIKAKAVDGSKEFYATKKMMIIK